MTEPCTSFFLPEKYSIALFQTTTTTTKREREIKSLGSGCISAFAERRFAHGSPWPSRWQPRDSASYSLNLFVTYIIYTSRIFFVA